MRKKLLILNLFLCLSLCPAVGLSVFAQDIAGEDETQPQQELVHEHSFIAEVIEPTYFEEGYTQYTCEECGYSYIDDYTDKKVLNDVRQLSVVQTLNNSASLKWESVEDAEGYAVYIWDDVKNEYVLAETTKENSIKITGLTGGKKVTFGVLAYISSGGGGAASF